MKKMTAFLTCTALLLASHTAFPVTAEEETVSVTEPADSTASKHTFEGEPLTDEEAEATLARLKDNYQEIDGVYYFKATEIITNDLFGFEPYIPNAGTYDRSELVRALITKYPDAKFAVNIQLWNDEIYSKNLHAYTERTHLYEHGITAEVTDYRTLYAILTADELENYPVSDENGYFIWLAEKPEGIIFRCMEQLDTYAGYMQYLEEVGDGEPFVLQNGVYWSAMPYPDEIVAEYVASEGTCDRVKLLAALAEVYPDAKFAVTISGGYNSENAPPYLSALEQQRFEENGIELLANPDRERCGYPRYAILTAEQVKAFPGDESFGYMLGLAPVCWVDGTLADTTDIMPTDPIDLTRGDANTDFSVDIMDVIFLNRYLLGGSSLTDAQKRNCDTNGDSKLDETDSLNILKFVVELTDIVGA